MKTVGEVPTSEALGRMGTSFGCNAFWDCLGGQTLGYDWSVVFKPNK